MSGLGEACQGVGYQLCNWADVWDIHSADFLCSSGLRRLAQVPKLMACECRWVVTTLRAADISIFGKFQVFCYCQHGSD